MFFKISIYIFSLVLYGCAVTKVPTTVYYKDGTIKKGIGFISENKINFANSKDDKTELIEFSLLDKAEFKFDVTPSVYVLMPIKDKDRPMVLEEIIVGQISLYQLQTQGYNASVNNTGGNFGSVGGMGYSYTVNDFYLKRKNENAATHLASSKLFSKNFTKAAKPYFLDCPDLIKKIENKEYKKRNLTEIVKFYNTKCN
ncbi:MAG: hypothetical protein ACSHW4_09600 [Cellulophaga sp.]